MLFTPQVARKPDLYPWTEQFIDAIWNSFWTPKKFDFEADYAQFKTILTDEERQVIVRTISAIGQIEVAVKTFWAKLGDNLPHPSLSDLGFAMANSEVVHNRAYEKLLDRLGLTEVFAENLKFPEIRGRVDYLRKYSQRVYEDDRKQYIYSIILFTLFIENVSLFSQFFIIRWFHKFHPAEMMLKDTAQQIQYTRFEEQIHAQVGIKIINTLREEYPDLFDAELEAKVVEECRVAFEAEDRVVKWIIGDAEFTGLDKEGATRTLNRRFLKGFVAQRLNDSMKAIGFTTPMYQLPDIDIETSWFEEEMYTNTMTDFFAKEPVEYGVNVKVSNEDLF